MVQISNYAIDSNTIKNNYSHLFNTLDVPGTTIGDKLSIYPNPASDNLHVSTEVACNYNICDVTGRVIKGGTLLQGDNSISLDQVSSGLYLLKLLSSDGAEQRVYRFSKQ
jgi:hypothetical protein